MFRPYVKRLIHSTVILALFNSLYTHAAISSDISLPDNEILELLESSTDWLPSPYKTPIEQGVLLDIDNLNKVVPGLSKEQVRFLLGTPSIIDLFHVDRWDYLYYERTEKGFTEPKRITIVFKNEKVGEVYNQDKLIKKMGSEIISDYTNAPTDENTKLVDEQNAYQEIIIAKRNDYLSSTKKNKLPVLLKRFRRHMEDNG